MVSRTVFKTAGRSDVGRLRQNNEDRFLIDADLGVLMVVDGVGGHAAGEQAAAIAVDTIHARLKRQTGSIDSRIREAITLANNEIFRRASTNEEWFGMACVLTVVVIDGDHIVVGHVGDTRLYKIRGGGLSKITADHSPVGEQEDAGALSEFEAMHHPRRNEVYRDVGTQMHDTHDEGFIQILRVPFEPDSAWVICSDGLSDLVTGEQIRATVERNAGDLAAVVDELIEAANVASGKDNITVVYIEGKGFARNNNGEGGALRTMAYGHRGGANAAESETEPTGYFTLQEPATATAVARTRESQPASAYSGSAVAQAPIAQVKRRGRGRAFLKGLALFTLGLVLGAATLLAAQWFSLLDPLRHGDNQSSKGGRRLIVGKNDGSEYQTINSALEAADRGGAEGVLMIEVEPGEYHEHISLRNGLSIISRVPGAAIIFAPDHGEHTGLGVSADGVDAATLAGFKITGNQAHPLSVGLRLTNSRVDVTDTEISNAERAGVEIGGSDRSTIRASYIHSYRDAGVMISGEAAPRLVRNVITREEQLPSSGRPAIQITEGARPRLQWNTIHESEDVQGLEGESKDEFRRNNFVIPRARDVREQANNPQQGQPRSRW